MRLKLIAGVVALCWIALGCSSADVSGDVESADSAVDVQDSATESAVAADPDEGAGGEAAEESTDDPWVSYVSPIQEFLGVDFSNFNVEDAEAEFAAQEREAQQVIASCMAELGWEYIPFDSSAVFGGSFDPFGEEGLEYGSAEWVAKYGFGITTQAFAQSQVGPDLVGYNDDAFPDPGEGPQDPNQAIVDGFSDSEREAYYSDLYGQGPEFDETLSEEEQQALFENFEPSGCQAQAYTSFGGGAEQEFYMEFSGELEEMYERVNSDPRVVAVQAELAECLAGDGHSFAADQDLWEQVYELFEPAMEPLYETSFVDPFEGLDPESMTEEEINEVLESFNPAGPELSADSLATLAELQTEELDLAADVLGCNPTFFTGGGQSDVFFEVLAEYEQQFLDDNAAGVADFAGIGSN